MVNSSLFEYMFFIFLRISTVITSTKYDKKPTNETKNPKHTIKTNRKQYV